jgi:hypothetical protein
MLREIFTKIASEMGAMLVQKGNTARVILGPVPMGESKPGIYIEMQDYGVDPLLRHHTLPQTEEAPSFSNYAHLIAFSVIPGNPDYDKQLQWMEDVVAFFDTRPFFQLMVDGQEYELAISMKSVSSNDFYQFWIARMEKPGPVVFYQARVSAI